MASFHVRYEAEDSGLLTLCHFLLFLYVHDVRYFDRVSPNCPNELLFK